MAFLHVANAVRGHAELGLSLGRDGGSLAGRLYLRGEALDLMGTSQLLQGLGRGERVGRAQGGDDADASQNGALGVLLLGCRHGGCCTLLHALDRRIVHEGRHDILLGRGLLQN